MDDMGRRADAPVAHARPAIPEDLPYKAEWIDEVKEAYKDRIKNPAVRELAAFDAALPKLTAGQGLFINILMQGRSRLKEQYETYFTTVDVPGNALGKTDLPTVKPPYVRFVPDLALDHNPRLETTMIHEYTHLATIEVYDNFGDPWPKDNPDEEKKVKEKLKYTYPDQNSKGEYILWNKWLATLSDPALRTQIIDVLRGYADYGGYGRDREALPHVVEIIYHLYAAKVDWWKITEGPISRVADLLAKFKYT